MCATGHLVSLATERLVLGGDRVRLCFTLPVLPENAKTPLRRGFASYYGGMRRGFLRFAKEKLARLNASLPIGAVLRTVVCHENAHIVSLCVDAIVTVDGDRRISRLSQLWDKGSGALVRPEALFERRRLPELRSLLERGALKRAESAGVSQCPDRRFLPGRRLAPRSLCISPLGAVFFCPPRFLSGGNGIFTLPVAAEELSRFLKAGAAEKLWGAGET